MDIISNAYLNDDFRFFDQVATLADAYCRELGIIFRSQTISSLQFAVQEISAPLFADVFAIRELLKLHYMTTAEVLIRPMLERVSTISYLRKSDQKVLSSWELGWKNKRTRPSLNNRIEFMDDLRNPFTGAVAPMDRAFHELLKGYKETLHSLVHGDRSSSYRSKHIDEVGNSYFAAGPNPHDASSLTRVSLYSASLTSYLLQELNIVFPELNVHFLSKAS